MCYAVVTGMMDIIGNDETYEPEVPTNKPVEPVALPPARKLCSVFNILNILVET